jgi:hypothetical protein
VMTLPDEDRMSGNVCELGTYRFGYSGDCDFLRHLKFWSATKKVKKLLAELPENETWDIPAMENNETIIKLLRVLVDNFDIELYKNLYTREIENNTENGRCMFMSHDIKCSQADYFTEPEISRLLKILSPLDKSTLEELLIDPKERAAKRAKTAAERKEFMDFWSAESLEKHLQNPDLKVSSLAKVECYCYKDPEGAAEDQSYCYSFYAENGESDDVTAKKKTAFILAWTKEHPMNFDWTDTMESGYQSVRLYAYEKRVLNAIGKKELSLNERIGAVEELAVKYGILDESGKIITTCAPMIRFTMPRLAELRLYFAYDTIGEMLKCETYEDAVESQEIFFDLVKEYSLGKIVNGHCELDPIYEQEFKNKKSDAYWIKWLNDEIPIEIEYQKRLREAKGIKKILVMASKPNHLATIE